MVSCECGAREASIAKCLSKHVCFGNMGRLA